jgi:tetratricopeptide (TPR) repeat protein
VRNARLAARVLASALVLLPGCASLPPPPTWGWSRVRPDRERLVRPEAPADYDFLVARELELQGKLGEAGEAYGRAIEKDPDSAFLRRRLAEIAARQGRYADALEQAERAHALDPDDVGTRLFLGTLYRLSKQPDKAEAVLRGADGAPIDDDAALLLYGVYLDADRLPDALAIAKDVIAREPDGLRGYFAAAAAYEKMGRPKDAERMLRQALKRQPGSLAVYGALARGRHEREDREGEIAIYREALVAHPHHAPTLSALADALVAQGRTDEAIRTLAELERRQPDDLRTRLRLAFLEYTSKRYDSAAERFDQALAAHPDQKEIHHYLGLVRVRQGDDARAIAEFEQVPPESDRFAESRIEIARLEEKRGDFAGALAEVEKAREKAATRPLDLYAASLRARSGDFDGAVRFLEGLLAQSPDDDEVLYSLGVVYGEAKRYDEALRYMNLCLEKNPDNASALNYVGYTWAEKGQKLDQAEAMIQRALALRPDDGFITDSLGWVYYMRARELSGSGRERDGRIELERAIEQLERARELTGGDPVISEHLGDAYLLRGEKRRALEEYGEAIGLGPRAGEQPELQRKYDALREELGER